MPQGPHNFRGDNGEDSIVTANKMKDVIISGNSAQFQLLQGSPTVYDVWPENASQINPT